MPVEYAVPKEEILLVVLFTWGDEDDDTNPLEAGEVPVEYAVPEEAGPSEVLFP